VPGIFISYRQEDAKAWAISLRDHLADVFGNDEVFLDKDTLHSGDWRKQLQVALDRCKVVLVVIGPRWLTITDERKRPRINLDDDVHHQELALALSRSELTIIPVLVDDATMPRAEQLPQDLQELCEKQARKIDDSHARRKVDLKMLVNDIRSIGQVRRCKWTRVAIVAMVVVVLLVVGITLLPNRGISTATVAPSTPGSAPAPKAAVRKPVQPEFEAQCSVQIGSPRNGESVGKEQLVEGSARVPSGSHLWVLVAKTGVRSWWPQGNGEAEIVNEHWATLTFLGRSGESGRFEISAVVVDSETNQHLNRWVEDGLVSNYAPLNTFPNPVAECEVGRVAVQKVRD